MHADSDDEVMAAREALVGRWECYAGDGIHGWQEHLIDILIVNRNFTVEHLYPSRQETPRMRRHFGPYVAHCSRGQYGWELKIDDCIGGEQSLWHARGAGDTIEIWQTEVGIIAMPRYNWYRRLPSNGGSLCTP